MRAGAAAHFAPGAVACAAACWVSHAVVGEGLLLNPGSENRFYLAQLGLDGQAGITRAVRVLAWYRPRKRVL